MFAKPRPKKTGIFGPPPSKKRKAAFAVEEVTFDDDARADYLTGFHKRKVQRQKEAQEVAAQKARLDKIAFRKQLREERQRTVEDHVKQVNEALRVARVAGGEEDDSAASDGTEQDDDDDEEWAGIADAAVPEFVDREEEYIDEDRFTTVTVEAVDIDRSGMHRRVADSTAGEDDEGDGNGDGDGGKNTHGKTATAKPTGGREAQKPKKKKKTFRYETKVERQMTQRKQKQSSRKTKR